MRIAFKAFEMGSIPFDFGGRGRSNEQNTRATSQKEKIDAMQLMWDGNPFVHYNIKKN